MGWSSGSQVAEELYADIRRRIPKAHRQEVAEKILETFENEDADDWSEDSLLWKDAGRPGFEEEEIDDEEVEE